MKLCLNVVFLYNFYKVVTYFLEGGRCLFPVLSGCAVVLNSFMTHESGPGGGGIEQPIKKREGLARPKKNINKK